MGELPSNGQRGITGWEEEGVVERERGKPVFERHSEQVFKLGYTTKRKIYGLAIQYGKSER